MYVFTPFHGNVVLTENCKQQWITIINYNNLNNAMLSEKFNQSILILIGK